jgi:Na+-driven multidrug efflux pump
VAVVKDRRELVLKAPLGRAIWSLAWPIAISNELAILTLGVMLFWLGRLIGEPGLAVESLLRPFTLLLAWLFAATSNGGAVLVSRSVGAEDGKGMSIAAGAVSLTAVMWVGITAIALATMPWLVDLLAGDLAIETPMVGFLLAWMLVALPGLAIAEVLLDVANSTGATKFNLVRVLVELAFTAALTPVLIDTLGIGIAGAPLAQGVAAVGLCVVLWVALVRMRGELKLGELGAGAFRIRWALWKEILAIGLPMQIARMAYFASQLILLNRISREGEAAVAGYGIAGAWLLFGAMATLALAQAGGILVGQSLGAKLYDRARRGVRATLLSGWLLMSLFVVATLFDRPIIALLTSDPEVADAAHRALSILRWAGFGIAAFQILLNAFGAYKATVRASMLLVGSEVLGLGVAFAWPGTYLDAACVAVVVSNVVKGILLIWLLATGHHRRDLVEDGADQVAEK